MQIGLLFQRVLVVTLPGRLDARMGDLDADDLVER